MDAARTAHGRFCGESPSIGKEPSGLNRHSRSVAVQEQICRFQGFASGVPRLITARVKIELYIEV